METEGNREPGPEACGDLASALSAIHARLIEHFGLPANARSHPTDELVLTILSQNTNDTNRDRAYHRLAERFLTWEEMEEADPAALAEAIRHGGLADMKAPRIQAVLRRIKERFGTYDLSPLCAWDTAKALEWLRSLPGVGPKTAACVMLFSCEKTVMPVDTHILRVSKRIGLLPGNAGGTAAHAILGAAVAPEQVYPLHISLIRHGRLVCQARRPLCGVCVLRDLCAYPYKTA